MLASASKDETVIIWSMERILQNLNNSSSIEQSDYIISMIDEHQHVIDCIKFAPEASCRTIQTSDYSKITIDQIQESGENEADNTHVDDSEIIEESKRGDEPSVSDAN